MYYTAWCATRCQASGGAGLEHVRYLQKLQHDQLLFRALAAVAVTGAAFAQSTVTLSGAIDFGLEKTASGAAIQAGNGRNSTNNITVSGSEDLGGGLKANYKVSSSFNTSYQDAGAAPVDAIFGNNDMFVELAGGFGSIKGGRSFNPVFSHALTANGTKGVTGYNTVGNALSNAGVYVSNQLLYTTPNFGGVTAQISYAPSEISGAKAHTGLGVRYAAGPLVVTYSSTKNVVTTAGTPVTAGTPDKALNQFAAAYDFGVARVLFTYQDKSGLASNADGAYAIGVTAPVGPGTLWASYDRKEVAAGDTKVIQLGYKYALSKRTLAYAQLGNKKTATAKTTGYGFGVAHSF